MKFAVILFNLGGPDSREAIEPFLMNFFMDKNIIQLPSPLRWILAKIISKRRTRKEAGESYGELGYASPLLENCLKQSEALKKALNEHENHTYETFVCMRYWHPQADETVQKVKAYDPDKIILLPLYPQYSTTTTRSSFEAWEKACKKQNFVVPTSKIKSYPDMEGFIQASAENILEIYKNHEKGNGEKGNRPRLLLSAHGLPEKIIRAGDPYQKQCEQTAHKIVEALHIKTREVDWRICYQSRVGPLKWIGPSIDEELKNAAHDQVPVIVYPHAFTQEHVETLVELDIEYKEMAHALGVPRFERAQTVGTHKKFISGLKDLILNHRMAH